MKFLFSIISAIAAFVAMRDFLMQSFFVSVVVSVVVFIFVFRGFKIMSRKLAEKKEAPDLNPDHEKIIKEGLEKIYHIRNNTYMIRNNSVAEELGSICSIGLDIFAELKKEPEEIRKARQFLNYYLDSTVTILDRYIDLNKRNDRTPEMLESIKKVEEILPEVKETFRRQLSALLENDLLDLNVELSLLDKTMKFEK